jgi:uncharacterized protein (AIM24 family)
MSSYVYDPSAYVPNQLGEGQIVGNGGQNLSNLLLYQLKGKPAFAYCDIHLKPKQRLVTDSNKMIWMEEKIDEPTTECWNGCMTSCYRKFGGEPCCLNTYTNNSEVDRKISIGFNDPGDLLTFGVSQGNGWILNRNAFLAGTDNLTITSRCMGCCAGPVSGEGMFVTRVHISEEAIQQGQGQGVFVAGSFGALVRHDVPATKKLYVSRGLFFAAHEETKFVLGLAGGLKNFCCTGGGGLVMIFEGPAVIYTQSRDNEKWNPYKNQHRQQRRKKGGAQGMNIGGN